MTDTRPRGPGGRILVTGPEHGLRPANYAEGVEARGYRRERQQREYEQRERGAFNRQLRESDHFALSDRKEAAARFLAAMRDEPEVVGERVSWLLDGSYGHGGMQMAKEVCANKRMNRRAWLTHAVGAVEWQCPLRMAAQAWKKLTAEQKKALDREVQKAIDEHEENS